MIIQSTRQAASLSGGVETNVNELVRAFGAVVDPSAPGIVRAGGIFTEPPKRYRQFTDVDAWMTQSGHVDYLMPQIYWGFEANRTKLTAGYAFATA